MFNLVPLVSLVVTHMILYLTVIHLSLIISTFIYCFQNNNNEETLNKSKKIRYIIFSIFVAFCYHVRNLKFVC